MELQYVRLDAKWAVDLEAIELACFPTVDPSDLYSAAEIRRLADVFAEGCFVVLDGAEPVGMGLGVRVNFDFDHAQHSIRELLGDDGVSGHVADGAWYYGTDIAVSPEHRRRGIGEELYRLRKDVCRNLNLQGLVAGGVIPGFADHKHELTAHEYIAKVIAGELYDSTLSFQIANGFEARDAIANYMDDPAVDGWASLIVWDNPDFSREHRLDESI
ncbi:MAG: ribosomal protein S18 acetylase RimI-like enzyme [Candidatus Poriferisodalaceae bacterium]|jgi:ribosomal protein S18 acetylase RimI-like enzyme